tara:strand:- start:113 stop:295 length:183 start_codon:yes stop_codon:yes gene_type:complete
MKKYTVEILVIQERYATIEVRAMNEESARSQADEMIPYTDYEPDSNTVFKEEIVEIHETK